MSLRLYMDHNIPGPITRGLRRRGIDVLTAEQDGRQQLSDPLLLTRADELGRLFFSFDKHLLAEAHRRQRAGEHFFGLTFAKSLAITIGQAIDSLEFICLTHQISDVENQVIYLPL